MGLPEVLLPYVAVGTATTTGTAAGSGEAEAALLLNGNDQIIAPDAEIRSAQDALLKAPAFALTALFAVLWPIYDLVILLPSHDHFNMLLEHCAMGVDPAAPGNRVISKMWMGPGRIANGFWTRGLRDAMYRERMESLRGVGGGGAAAGQKGGERGKDGGNTFEVDFARGESRKNLDGMSR